MIGNVLTESAIKKVSPATLTKAPLVKLGHSRNPVLATPSIRIRSVLRLSFDFLSSHITRHAERKTTKVTMGHILTIRSRNPTGIHAATTSAAQIEFAASQKRQELAKLNENETDECLSIQFLTELDEKPLKSCETLILVLSVRRCSFSLQAIRKSSGD